MLSPILTCSISTWIVPVLRGCLRSLPAVGSRACDQCGSVFVVRAEDGTSFSTVTITCHASNKLRYSLRLVLTAGGKLLIYDECGPLKAVASPIPSGATAGTSSTPTNSRDDYWRARGLTPDDSAQFCGCYPGTHHVCTAHRDDYDDFLTRRPLWNTGE